MPHLTKDLARVFAKCNLNTTQWRVLWAIIYLETQMSAIADIQTITNLSSTLITKALETLYNRNIINITAHRNLLKNIYYIEPDITNWTTNASMERLPLNAQCKRCGAQENLERHHMTHRTDGGKNNTSNITIYCHGCHIYNHTLESICNAIKHEIQPNRLTVLKLRKSVTIEQNKPHLIRIRGYKSYWLFNKCNLPPKKKNQKEV